MRDWLDYIIFNVVESGQQVTRDDIPNELKNIVSIQSTSNVKRDVLFSSGVFSIKEGRNLEKNDKFKILVHEEFAEHNKLKLGDKVSLEFINANECLKAIKNWIWNSWCFYWKETGNSNWFVFWLDGKYDVYWLLIQHKRLW